MNYREGSRQDWQRTDDELPSTEHLTLGCLQRIADATEKMALSHEKLLADKLFWERRCKDEREINERLGHTNAALRGVITKLKKHPQLFR